MVLIAYRHGLRVSELTNLEWSQIDLTTGTISLVGQLIASGMA
jgi:integrase